MCTDNIVLFKPSALKTFEALFFIVLSQSCPQQGASHIITCVNPADLKDCIACFVALTQPEVLLLPHGSLPMLIITKSSLPSNTLFSSIQ